ncbi:MAG: ABC transporter ATP-binding protein [Myxococcota bacterium]
MPAAIELVDATKDFPAPRRLREIARRPFDDPRRPVLHGVSLHVDPGEIVVMVGPNGSGKTTCLHLLAGLLRPTTGRARVLGRDPCDDAARALLGFSSASDRGFHTRLSVRENLRFFAALHGLRGPALVGRLGELAGSLEIGELLDSPFRVLSAGQRARVALARALLHRPKALLLDEATRSLDPGAARRFREHVVKRLVGDEGLAVLYTSHDLAEVRQIASRVVLLDAGRVVREGPWAEVEAAVEATFFAEVPA